MSVFLKKLRHIYAPFLIVTAGFVASYSLLAWALVYRTRLVNLDEDLVTFWLPFGLAWFPLLAWIRPRIKVLDLETVYGRWPGVFLMVAAATMIGPTILAQMYLSQAAATTTRLGEAADISHSPATKYYRIERTCLQREGYQSHWSAELTGRQSENLTFTIAVAVPFCGAAGTQHATAPAWLGITFRKSIHAALPDDQKDAEARTFAMDSEAEFAKMDIGSFTYLELLGPGATRRSFEAAIRKSGLSSPAPIVLLPHHDSFEVRAGGSGALALQFYLGGAVFWFVLILIPGIHASRLRDLVDGARATREPKRAWRTFLIPSRETPGLVWLAYVNVLVFLVMVFAGLGVVSFSVEDLVAWGGLSRPLLHGAGLLRLFTAQFVHGGIMHIAYNLYGLMFGGMLLEGAIGRWRLLVAYVVTGLAGGISSVVVHQATVTVGASGSIFGLFGVLFGLLALKDKQVLPARNVLLVNAGIYVGLNLLLGAVQPGVDNAAHVGGLLAGLLVAPLLRRANMGRHEKKSAPQSS